MHFARSDDITPSFHLPAWEPEQPSWRELQLLGTVPEVSADVEGLTLDYDLVAPEAPNYKKSDDGRLLAIVRAHGPLRGEMEGTLELHITQVIVPKPPNMDISRALPMHIGTLFKIHSGDDALEGSYTGTMYPMLDASGTGTARVQGTGQVISVSTGFIDLFLYYVFVEDVVKMVEGTGTGARGPMMLKSGT